MSAIRSFFAKLPRPSVRQAAAGASAVSIVSAGVWYFQKNAAGRDTAYDKFLEKVPGMKKEAQPAASEEAMNKQADTKPQQAAEEAAGK
ncbi:unnamed protein product [Alopecurus aequalis]